MTAMLLVQVATESGDVAMTVLEPLATTCARGGASLCQTGPRSGQQSVLKHGGRPSELYLRATERSECCTTLRTLQASSAGRC